MPIYEYRCEDGHQYELSEGFEASTEQSCRHCGRPARRLLSLPAVIFKGPGFYSTDNRKDGHKQEDTAARAVPGEKPSSEKKPEPEKKPESAS